MNKNLVRWLLLVVLVLALVGGGIFAFFQFFRPGGETAIPGLPTVTPKPLQAADLVPAETPVFLRIPDAPRAIARFKTSPAFTLMTDPGVIESWKNAGAKVGEDGNPEPAWEGWPQFLSLIAGLAELADGEAFIAVTELHDRADMPGASAIAGIRVTADDAAVGSWLEQVRALDPELKWNSVPDVLHSYYTATPKSDQPDTVLCAARMDRWVFFGVGPKAFEAVLARAADTVRQPGSLAEAPTFKEALTGLPEDPDLLTYVNMAPMLPWLGKLAQFQEAKARQADPTADSTSATPTDFAAKFKALKALAATTNFSANDWLDGMRFLSTPGNTFLTDALRTPLSGLTYRFISRDALFCVVQDIDFPNTLIQMKESNPELADKIDEFAGMADGFLASGGLSLQSDILDNLGPEATTVLDWAPGNPIPTLLVAWQHRKQEPMKKTLDLLAASAAAFGGLVQVESSLVGTHPAYTISSPLAPVPPFTFYLGPDVLVLAFNAGTAEAIAAKSGPGLLGSPEYQALRDRLGPPAIQQPVQIVYADLRRLYANLHGAAGAYLPMIPGFDASAVSLPNPDQVEPYLGRTLWLTGIDGDTATSSAIHEKVHPLFLLAASVGWIADMGTKFPKKQPQVPAEADGMFEAEILEMETGTADPAMAPALPGDPEPIFDNIPANPGAPATAEP